MISIYRTNSFSWKWKISCFSGTKTMNSRTKKTKYSLYTKSIWWHIFSFTFPRIWKNWDCSVIGKLGNSFFRSRSSSYFMENCFRTREENVYCRDTTENDTFKNPPNSICPKSTLGYRIQSWWKRCQSSTLSSKWYPKSYILSGMKKMIYRISMSYDCSSDYQWGT